MNYVIIEGWQKRRNVARIIRATFPGYKRRKVIVSAAESVRLDGLNWSDGSRSEYCACTLDGLELWNSGRYSAMAPWDKDNPEGKAVPIPAGSVTVQGGTSCGKVATLYIYVNTADMPKVIND